MEKKVLPSKLPKAPAQRKVAYFSHDWSDAAIKRRVSGFRRDGITVSGFSMHRQDDEMPEWVECDLGPTADNAYFGRVAALKRGAQLAQRQRQVLARADVFVARNLDMLLVAILARSKAGLNTPVIYECLDIHRFLVRGDLLGRLFRKIEAWALRRTVGVWVSSPAFIKEYFHPVHGELPGMNLLENRFQVAPGIRPTTDVSTNNDGVLRIGWFGNLRCERSLSLLEALTERMAGKVEIMLHGYPATAEIPDFHERVQRNDALHFGGRYQWPDDLKKLYDTVDVVWAGDFMDAGKNSKWLLPNRLYEGGWYGCPSIAPQDCETGRWISDRGCGFTVSEPIEDNLPALIMSLCSNPKQLAPKRATLARLPDSTFVEPANTLSTLFSNAIKNADTLFRPKGAQ